METYKTDYWSDTFISILDGLDYVFNGLFIIEAFIKIVRLGFVFCPESYLRDSWSQLDFFIVSASLIDMSLANVQITFIKVLRILRTLRPLRFISHNRNMKVVVNALMESLVAILNVSIVILMVWIMFGILGISFLKDEMGYCSGLDNYYNISQNTCNQMGHEWKIWPWNFDNIGNALITLFILSSLEGWPNVMANVFDANTADKGPDFNYNYLFTYIFFIAFVLVSAMFLMNLFMGVIYLQFSIEMQKDKFDQFPDCEEEQLNWLEMQPLISKAKPEFSETAPPENRWRLVVFKLVTHIGFEAFIMLLIILNIFTMGVIYEEMSTSFEAILVMMNLVFTFSFIVECILKIFGLGFHYFKSSWNIFDFSIVITSIFDLMLSLIGASFIPFLRSGAQIIRVVRVLRVSRLFKILKSKKLEGINKVLKTIIYAFPS